MNVGLLIVTHSNLGTNLLDTARDVLSVCPLLAKAYSIPADYDTELALREIASLTRELDHGDGVLILTDMYGSTPSNIASQLATDHPVSIVAGINLPMLIKFLNLRSTTDLESVVEQICQKGRRSIQVASQLLDRKHPPAGKE